MIDAITVNASGFEEVVILLVQKNLPFEGKDDVIGVIQSRMPLQVKLRSTL